MFENGCHVDKDDEMALKYYSIAKGAIVLRRNIYAHFGDRSVERGIDKSLERLNYVSKKISRIENIQNILYQFGEYEEHTAKIKVNKKGETILTLFKPKNIDKLIVDFNKKKYYFTNKISLIIKMKDEINPKCLDNVQIHYDEIK